jgi:hypothetical protein
MLVSGLKRGFSMNDDRAARKTGAWQRPEVLSLAGENLIAEAARDSIQQIAARSWIENSTHASYRPVDTPAEVKQALVEWVRGYALTP